MEMASSNRRGKLSLKGRRNAESSGDDDDVTLSASADIRKKTGEDGKFTAGIAPPPLFPTAQPTIQNIDPCMKATTPFCGSGSTTRPFRTAKWESVNVGANLPSHQCSRDQEQTQLSELPAWYCLKDSKEEEPPSEQEIIKIGDISFEWHPLPEYCQLCLVRSKHDRLREARELHKRSSLSRGTSELKKNDTGQDLAQIAQNDAKKLYTRAEGPSPSLNEKRDMLDKLLEDFDLKRECVQQKSRLAASSQTETLANNQHYSFSKSERSVQNVPLLVHRDCISKNNVNLGSTSSKSEQQPSTPLKNAPKLSSPKSRNERAMLSRRHSRKCDPSHIDTNKTLHVPSFQTEPSYKSPPCSNVKLDDIQKKVIEEPDIGNRIMKSGPIKNSSNSELYSSSRTTYKTDFSDIPPKVTGISFKENVDSSSKSLCDQQTSDSSKKLPRMLTSTPRSQKSAPSSSKSNIKLTRIYGAGANSDQSKYDAHPSDTSRKQSALKSSQSTSFSATSVPRHQQESRDLNSSSHEAIVIDSDEEEAFPNLPDVSSASLSTGSKRKLSGTSTDTDKKIAKKPKLVDSAADAPRNPATRLTHEPKSHSVTECRRGQFMHPLGGQNTAQTKLDGMLVRTKPDVSQMSPSSLQASLMRKPVTTTQGNHKHSQHDTSGKEVSKQTPSMQRKHIGHTASNSSSLSSNIKPLFKIQMPEAETLETPQYIPMNAGASISTSTFNRQTQCQKAFVNGKEASDSRKAHQQSATTSTKSPLGKMSSFTSPVSDVPPSQNMMPSQRKKQSFQPNQVIWDLAKQPRESSTSSTNQRSGNTGSYSGFQSARCIQTNRDIHPKKNNGPTPTRDELKNQDVYPKRDKQTNSAREIHPNQDIHPKRDKQTNSAWEITQSFARIVHQGTNQDNKAKLVSYQYANTNQHTVWGTKENDSIQSCPLCQLLLPQDWTTFQRDGHIAVCLSESSDDVIW